MADTEHKCVGCQTSHLAALWYRREGETDTLYFQEWLCGIKYRELPDKEQQLWELNEPSW